MIDGKWQEWSDVVDIARALDIKTVPFINCINYLPKSKDDLMNIIPYSYVGIEEGNYNIRPEGIVARTDPVHYMTDGRKVMWKLKYSDFD